VSVLPYGKRKARYAVIDGTPYFASADIFALCNLAPGKTFFSDWLPGHLVLELLFDESTEEALDGVTLAGAETIAARAKYPVSKIVAAWARNRVAIMFADEQGKPQRPPLTLLANGDMPPKPDVMSDDFNAWSDHRSGRKPLPAPMIGHAVAL
jgi:hypothetical protein